MLFTQLPCQRQCLQRKINSVRPRPQGSQFDAIPTRPCPNLQDALASDFQTTLHCPDQLFMTRGGRRLAAGPCKPPIRGFGFSHGLYHSVHTSLPSQPKGKSGRGNRLASGLRPPGNALLDLPGAILRYEFQAIPEQPCFARSLAKGRNVVLKASAGANPCTQACKERRGT